MYGPVKNSNYQYMKAKYETGNGFERHQHHQDHIFHNDERIWTRRRL